LLRLNSIREVQQKAQESSARLRSQYAAISSSFNKLIVSIQFHDITRQQIEHVIEVLELFSIQGEADGFDISGYPPGMSRVLGLQSAQLADAAQKFASSVVVVERSLGEIADHVIAMSGESRMLSGMSQGVEGSIFLSMEQDFCMILTGLDQTANTGSATKVAQQGLREIIGQMQEPIHEIQKIELEMRRIALNAQISACNLGPAGIALEVLSGSVQQLASECRGRSESLSSTRWAVTGERRQRKPVSSGGTRATDGTMKELRLAVDDMHSSSDRGSTLIQKIVARGDSVARELSATRDGFSAGSLFAAAIGRVQGTIGEMAAKAESSLPLGDDYEPKIVFADLASHYTMQAERDVHDAVDRAKAEYVSVVEPVKERAAFPGDGDELGDNIEFF
jgi:hypothetical protein